MMHRRAFARSGHLAIRSFRFLLVLSIGLQGALAAAPDADIIVIGAGIAGLSSALEASSMNADVLVIETASVPGGHAVKAGGFALVGTPLQESKGYQDSPDLAFRDLMAWGEDADPQWVRQFVERARVDIYDWLTALGVKFTILLDTPEDSVPRFHFAGGTAVNVIVPMLRAAASRDNLTLQMNSRATGLQRLDNGHFSVQVRHLRTGTTQTFTAAAVIIATGGFQSNLDLVRQHLQVPGAQEVAVPKELLIGSGQFADGNGLQMGLSAGAQLTRMERQVIFVNGLPDPRNPERGLNIENPAAIRVNASGQRFMNEAAASKILETTVLQLEPPMHWLIFDDQGRKKLRARGAAWLNRNTIVTGLLENPQAVQSAATIPALAKATGLPPAALGRTIDNYNAYIAAGHDLEFGRFGSLTEPDAGSEKPLIKPPFYALRLLPMTRKSLGGLAINLQTQVLDTADQPIAGLYAAGEATGVAGINGLYGGSGTFLAPSVLTGRMAGQQAAAHASGQRGEARPNQRDMNAPQATSASLAAMQTATIRALVSVSRPGYWHWERSHQLVIDRDLACSGCHSAQWPGVPADSRQQRLLQLESCTECH